MNFIIEFLKNSCYQLLDSGI